VPRRFTSAEIEVPPFLPDRLWERFAVAMVAPAGIRRWWYEEDGRLAFHSGIREMIDQRLQDAANPPVPITEAWTIFKPDAWESVWRDRDT